MVSKFANRVKNLAPAAVYEILKATTEGKAIPFSAGNPGFEAIPHEKIANVAAKILAENPNTALQYGMTEGFAPLRGKITEFLQKNLNISAEKNRLLVTHGATQAIELCAKAFCNEGDVVITENPSFVGTLATFSSYGINVAGVEMEHDGMNLDKLQEEFDKHEKVSFVYVIPDFHNPTGWTTSLEKRKRLYEMCLAKGTLILEDDPYGMLRYDGEKIPTLKSMDTEGIVLYVGSFSKLISPGLRVGFLLANDIYMDKITAAKQVSDVYTAMINQMIINRFMEDYGLEAHINEICGIYREKLQVALDSLDEHLGDYISYVKPEGGLYVYCKLPEHIDSIEFFKAGIEAGVAVVYGSAFSVDPDEKSQYFRINFSSPSIEQLKRGIEILGEVMRKF